MLKGTNTFLCGLACATALTGSAMAGGFSRGTADTDILFEDGNFAMRSGATYVNPTRKYNVNGNPLLLGTDPLDSYVIPSIAFKAQLVQDLSCAGTYTDAYGGSTTFASPTVTGKTAESFTVAEFGLTCGYNYNVGNGFVTFILGAFAEQINYSLTTFLPTTTTVSGTEYGWRAGVAYSIPEIAFRAQLLYRSGTEHNPTGLTNGVVPASANGTLPQSIELRAQTGIAPSWLAFGSIKWTNWSVLDTLNLNAGVFTSANQYFYDDGWTVSGGVGHQINETVSAFGALSWDKGVGTGWDTDSDKFSVASGVSVSANHITMRFGGAYTFIKGATETQYGAGVNAGYGDGHAWSLSASATGSF